MKTTGACGRADLVRALAAGDTDAVTAVADLLGCARRARVRLEGTLTAGGSATAVFGSDKADAAPVEAKALVDVPFWRIEAFEGISEPVPAEPRIEVADVIWDNPPTETPLLHVLSPWRELQPRLRREATEPRETKDVDVSAVVRRLSEGGLLERVPREHRRRWGPRLQLILDRSDRLVPFWTDQNLVAGALARLVPEHTLDLALFWEGLREPRLFVEGQPAKRYSLPPPGSTVLVLGDLGCLAAGDPLPRQRWRALGCRLADAGCRAVAMIPAPSPRFPGGLGQHWQMISWGRFRGPAVADPLQLRRRAERLLRLVSPAVRIEPGFLRAVRLLLPPEEADAATEADVWQHPAVTSTSIDGATLDPAQAALLRAAFARDAEQDPQLHRRVLALLRLWRGHLPREIWFEEVQSLAPATRRLLPDPSDVALAQRFFLQLSQRARGVAPGTPGAGALSWFRRCERRLTPSAWTDPGVGAALHQLSWSLHEQDAGFRPAAGFDPALVPATWERRLALVQKGAVLCVTELSEPTALPDGTASPFGLLRSGNGLVQLTVAANAGRKDPNFWEIGRAPPWATDWGWDQYAAWVEFSINELAAGERVTQRMRWIQPGSFQMGSATQEPGRWVDEGHRHEVGIREGFWLFETACTQALWVAVMGKNPARFNGARRPVERVSWNDAQCFIAALNERLPGLALSLPSEARWEYACRAGSTTRYSFGDDEGRLGEHAWFNENAGGETHPVRERKPNAWGLYDMQGNILEWVQDVWSHRYHGAPADGSAWESKDTAAVRVLRGGSWRSEARSCRCAYRVGYQPDSNNDDLGFRCARVQGREPGSAGSGASTLDTARPAERIRPGGHEIGTRNGSSSFDSGSVLLRLDAGIEASAPLPRAPVIHIRTDREQFTLGGIAKPDWARAIGRDRFGLWCEIAVETNQGEPVVQRLRWIPPGRFRMGSPPDEPGHHPVEGPQHLVSLGSGYWLFDTPCTQSLWEALMGDNPSAFRTPDRPVESVGWEEVKGFLDALNHRLGEADGRFQLPSEAQWEYACRAGTTTALYSGSIEILGDANAPALDPIAWYGGNSGVGFELANGLERTWLREMQYPEGRAGTHPVKGKRPNPWGLYDMLGNVWEWTQDVWVDSYEGAPSDGAARKRDDASAVRVVRGGSWSVNARHCRCAYRLKDDPDLRFNLLGFRCARTQES